MSNTNSAKALRSPVAKATGYEGYMGDLVAWQFARGGDHAFKAPRDKVRAVFEANGFGKCLDDKLSDPAAALAEATRQGKVGRGFIAQEFAKKNDDTPYAVGIYYRSGAGEHGDEMVCSARVRIEGGLAVVRGPEGGLPTDVDQDKAKQCGIIAAEIAKAANLRITHIFSTELSGAIVAAGRECWWASFRRAGGVYWVHADKAPRFRALLDALEPLGGFWATLQPLYGDEDGRTMRNIKSAATGALEAELDELVADLKKAQADGMKEASVETRRVRCQELVIRANLYRAVLESSHAGIVQRIDGISRDYGKLLDTTETDNAFDTAGI